MSIKQYKIKWVQQPDGRWFVDLLKSPKSFQFFGLYTTFEWDVSFPTIDRDADRQYLHGRLDEICYGYHFADPRKAGIVELGEGLMSVIYDIHPGAKLYIDYDRANFPIVIIGS